MDRKIYGYIRVSSKDQNEARQMAAMLEFGISPKKIYLDKQSGKDFDRPGYRRLLSKIKPGDVIVVKSIDRLGRNYDDIQKQWHSITREKRVDIVVLDMPLLDTRQKDQDLTGIFIADLVLQILSYVAQIERENIRQRQAEGIAAAKALGVRFGRMSLSVPEAFYPLAIQYGRGEISSRKAASQLGISHSTFLKWYNQWKLENDMK